VSTTRVVVIGSSWGGLHALHRVLEALPADLPAAVCIAQHRAADDDEAALAGLLARRCSLPVRDAEDKDELRDGEVLLAPPDYHLLVEPGEVALSVDEPVRFSRPSIDVLFNSAADAYRERAIGVVLTGSNPDGAQGLARIRARGGHALVQDPATAERAEMPLAALAATDAMVAPLDELGHRLTHVVRELAGAGGRAS
jgi:two-component system, chemotaxis family, protein-glutamate methylesterase/glutaminase